MRDSLIFSAFIVYEWFLCHSSLFRPTGKFCDPPACFLKNKKDGIACRPSCRNTATPVACSIAGRKSWNKALLPATSLHAVNLFYSSAILR